MPADNNGIVKATGALTTTTTGSVVDLGNRPLLPIVFKYNVTSITGATGTQAMKIQDCATSNGTFVDLCHFPNVTTAVKTYYRSTRPERYVKYVATLSGTTPNFTSQIDVVAAGRDVKF
jgi:hypothetical protein